MRLDFNTILNIVKNHDWFEFFEVIKQGEKTISVRPKSWVIYIYMTLPFYIAANLSGKDLVEILYAKAKQKHPKLKWENVENCIASLFLETDLFAEILHWFLEGGKAEFQKVVYLESLKLFYKYGWRLGTAIQQKQEIERFIIENVESIGNA